jgi:hypothetical protein
MDRLNYLKKEVSNKKDYFWGSELLNVENAKTVKGEILGYLTGVLYLAPSDVSLSYGGKNICPWASKGCREGCLYSAGRGVYSSTEASRIAKTLKYLYKREEFLTELRMSIEKNIIMSRNNGMTPAFRLNGTSDIGWDKLGIMDEYSDHIFYDYTKSKNRVLNNKVENWHLTFSKSESNDEEVEEVIKNSEANIAVVFNIKKKENMPLTYMGRKVIDCDEHDLRFLDDRNVICGLRAKGKAQYDTSGFVVQINKKSIDSKVKSA